MKWLKNEITKMSSFLLMLGACYYSPSLLTVLGTFLCMEHLYSYGEMTFFDFLGHEWLGLILFTIGALFVNWWMIIPFVIGWLIVADFEYFNPYEYLLKKARAI